MYKVNKKTMSLGKTTPLDLQLYERVCKYFKLKLEPGNILSRKKNSKKYRKNKSVSVYYKPILIKT